MIRKILICTRAGIRIFYRDYDNIEFFDEDLFGAYLSIVSSFIKEKLDAKMYSMQMNELGIVFEYGESILVSAIYDIGDNRDTIKIALGLIKDAVQFFFKAACYKYGRSYIRAL